MDNKNNKEDFADPDFFINIKNAIEKELSNLQKIVNNISQLRVEAAYLESDLITMVDAETWKDISELIGLGSHLMNAGFNEDVI